MANRARGGLGDFTNPILLNKPIFISTSGDWGFANCKTLKNLVLENNFSYGIELHINLKHIKLYRKLPELFDRPPSWQSVSENEQNPNLTPKEKERKREDL